MELLFPLAVIIVLVILFSALGLAFHLQKRLCDRLDNIFNDIDIGINEVRAEFTKFKNFNEEVTGLINNSDAKNRFINEFKKGRVKLSNEFKKGRVKLSNEFKKGSGEVIK